MCAAMRSWVSLGICALLQIVLAVSSNQAEAKSLSSYEAQPMGFSRLPDDGIRRRLTGCWDLAAVSSEICFDGVDHTEMKVESAVVGSGTFTVIAGRVLFDFSPQRNPPNEVYASCAVKASPSYRPDQVLDSVTLTSCAHWDSFDPAIVLPASGQIVAKRVKSAWLMRELYQGDGGSIINAPLKGCWDAAQTRDRAKYVAEMTKQMGGYLSSYQVCFDANNRGTQTWSTADAFDGWDGESKFRMVGGWLEVSDTDGGVVRCTAAVSKDRLSTSRCATWVRAKAGNMVPVRAEEPTVYVRLERAP
jgi:hypothetical protein